MFRALQNERGLTLVEMAVGLTLAAIAAAVTFGVFTSTQNSYYQTRDISEAQAELRVVSGMMTTEFRSLGSNPLEDAGVAFEPIGLALDDVIQIRMDLNGDGFINGWAEPAEEVLYTYAVASKEIYRVTWAGFFVVMAGVEDFGIRYFDEAGAELGPTPLSPEQRGQVRSLQLDFSVRGPDGVLRDWSTTSGIRNDLSG
jgi:prepilin-type N-terminal cleavage/methylation domain-containing protein